MTDTKRNFYRILEWTRASQDTEGKGNERNLCGSVLNGRRNEHTESLPTYPIDELYVCQLLFVPLFPIQT